MTDIWELLEKMDCEECSIHDECDNKNLCAEWITKAQPELLKLKAKASKWDKLIEALSKDIIDKDDLVNLEYGPEELPSSDETQEVA